MVAAGNEHGVVTVFQIPKNLPDTLPDCMKPKQMKQVLLWKSFIIFLFCFM